MALRYGVSIPPFADPARLVAIGVAAEEAGWHGVFLWDHVHLIRAMRLDVHDPWVVLGAIATRTERVRLGTIVTPVPRRRPWKLAKEVVTLDHLSRGRAVLGVGLGEPASDEYAAFGEDPDPRRRADVLDEALGLIDGFLRGQPVVAGGDHFTVDAELLPAAVQEPRPPIWVAATVTGKRALRRALRWDGVATIGAEGDLVAPDDLAAYLDGVDLPPGFDVLAPLAPDHEPGAFADAGATWLLESRWPVDDWVDDLEASVRRGPPA